MNVVSRDIGIDIFVDIKVPIFCLDHTHAAGS